MYVRINKKMVGICINKDAKNFQNFLVRPFLAIFGRFWAFLAITWDLQMLECWFWCQTSCFVMNFLKKIFKIFFGAKKIFFWARGGHFGYPNHPSTMKFLILTKLCHFHIKYMLESTKKTLGPVQSKELKIAKIC